jgi:hypothetical protein
LLGGGRGQSGAPGAPAQSTAPKGTPSSSTRLPTMPTSSLPSSESFLSNEPSVTRRLFGGF